MARRHVRLAPLLGTTVDVEVETGTRLGWSPRSARSIETGVSGELRRLEAVFNVYDPDSEISKLVKDADRHYLADGRSCPFVTQVSAELAEVLSLALDWHTCSDGLFNPLIGRIVALWQQGRQRDSVPEKGRLAKAVEEIASMPFSMEGRMVTAYNRLTGLNLNSLAKGWIVDRALESAIGSAEDRAVGDGRGARSVFINAGGDIARRGVGWLDIRVEDPHRPYDNVPPLGTVRLTGGGFATSGRSRRPIEINGRLFNHLLNPRTGVAADEVAAASVMADDAATADVLATILAVSSLTGARRLTHSDLFSRRGAAAMVVGSDGSRYQNDMWQWSGATEAGP